MFTQNSGLKTNTDYNKFVFIKYLIFILKKAFQRWSSNNYIVTFKTPKKAFFLCLYKFRKVFVLSEYELFA